MGSPYRLVFRGKYLPGVSAEEAMTNLAVLFNVAVERIQALLATQPSVIKQNISLEDGNRYLEVLAEAGLITHLEALAAENNAPVAGSGWDGIERRLQGRRRPSKDRRETHRGAAIQPDRRRGRGRRSTD
jgi:hypothetical protein